MQIKPNRSWKKEEISKSRFFLCFALRKLGCINFFSSICGQNMSLCGQILLPKQWFKMPTCLFRPKPYLKTPNARYFLNQNDPWVSKLVWKKRELDLRCGVVVEAKTVRKGKKKSKKMFGKKKIILEIFSWKISYCLIYVPVV